MQIGDLVKWENAGGEYELGIITDMSQAIQEMFNGVLVHFIADDTVSCMPKDDLEVINEKR